MFDIYNLYLKQQMKIWFLSFIGFDFWDQKVDKVRFSDLTLESSLTTWVGLKLDIGGGN